MHEAPKRVEEHPRLLVRKDGALAGPEPDLT
jgi:hypothetical protein